MMGPMDRDWARLGTALQAARKARGLSQEETAQRLGVGRSAIQNIERGVSFKKITPTIRAYANHVGWRNGSIESVLAGGEPAEAPAEPAQPKSAGQPAPPEPPGDLPLRIVQELGDGPLLDTTVLDLSDGDSDARMVVVVKGKPNATPEQIRRALLLWERTEAQIRGLSNDSGSHSVEEA